jgi:hypothetical protein
MNSNPALSGRFLQDLNRVSTALEPPIEIDRFVHDLDLVQQAVSVDPKAGTAVPESDFENLANLFEKMKSDTLRRLGGENWRSRLPEHDPLRSPVGLFGPLDLGLRETAHTRALAWLMDPNRIDHGFGDTLLRAFLREIFDLSVDPQLFQVIVESETVSGENRDRLDICMCGMWRLSDRKPESWLVIVEAKIDAGEGKDQCARYEKQSREKIARSRRHALVFLSPDGRPSATGSKRRWKRFTFTKLMAIFRAQLPTLNGTVGFEYLRLYMTGVLKDICDLNCGGISQQHDIYRLSEYLTFESNERK